MSEIKKEKKVYKYSKEKIQEYNKRYYEKHSNEIITCNICFKQYNGLNKSYHGHSKNHLMALQLLQTLTTPKDS
jgi:hypothetical protein